MIKLFKVMWLFYKSLGQRGNIMDAELEFSDAQAITANATTVVSTNLIDQGALTDWKGTALNEFGQESGRMFLVVEVETAPTAGTGIQVELTDCATETGTYKPTGIGLNAAIPIATLIGGYRMLCVPLIPGLMRYLKLLYTTTGDHTASAGTVNAYLSRVPTTQNVAPYRA